MAAGSRAKGRHKRNICGFVRLGACLKGRPRGRQVSCASPPLRQAQSATSSLGSLSHCHTAVYSTYACDVRQRWLGLARQEGRLGQQKLGSKS